MRLIPSALTFGATNILVAEKLHLDLLKAESRAALATARARVKRKGRGAQTRSNASGTAAKSSRILSKTPRYTAGVERGERASGDWSTRRSCSTRCAPVIPLHAPALVQSQGPLVAANSHITHPG